MSGGRKVDCLSLVAIIFAAACGGEAAGPAAGPGAPRGGDDPRVAAFVEQMNAHRQSEGCGALAWHQGVADVAQAHSLDMVERDYFSHTNPDGADPFDRLSGAGITWSGGAGENIAYGTSDAATVLEMWLDSSGHRANIENCGFTHHGVGLASGRWTHVFVTNPG